jgi:hypothetical protein
MSIPVLERDCSANDIVEAMQSAGACIVRDLLRDKSLNHVNSGLEPWISRSEPGSDDLPDDTPNAPGHW